ncbi:MAG: branched-chain amino acid aminotransferase [Limnochordia bacterium]|nr:branched-chain amino acid aminotransferase [Limnochordia bacterium]MDI9465647.1 branched-chain amino acid aminotransferase [Bacillota bacterium]NLO95329.1 branched-chain amino acid aminotransferase [Bacillota bacterium]HAI52512.1 branched chain amino acid aminotransferase [Bacillota bacterium]HAN95062.1 branched chain amino acid aminotransferase [Bacillota bacterium]
MEITLVKTTKPKPKPDPEKLGFGRVFTDHMFIWDYSEGKGWHNPRIVPYGPLEMDPACAVLHYGQAVFEGMKAYKAPDGRILLFRPEQNMARLNRSNARLSIPQFDEELALQAIKQLVALERDWIPTAPGTALYIRPFIIATDNILGVRPSSSYKFIVILSPVGAYYEEGLNPVSIYVEPYYVRAVRGGTGFAKAAGNYAGSLLAQKNAQAKGYSQVLWLDGIERRYVEEVGAMNVFFNIGGELITPDLGDSILPGVTRDSILQLLRSWGVPTVERRLSVDEVFEAHAQGRLVEAFGCGTAAVVSPIGRLGYREQVIEISGGKIGELTQRLYDTLTGIQTGKLPDPFGWVVEIDI